MRQALRSLVRMRASAVAAILTLTLGIGATTTLFSVVYAALLRPLPFPEPNRLVMLYVTRTTPRAGTVRGRWSFIEFTTLRSTASSFEDIAAYTAPTVAIGGNGEPEQIDAETTSSTYFRMLRVTPLLGRFFTPADDAIAGREPVALISERLWRRRFESRPEVVGQPILVNQIPLTIVGVLPEAFNGLSGRADVWFPLTMAPRLTYTEYLTTTQHFITVVA